jgi:hypothetical protein
LRKLKGPRSSAGTRLAKDVARQALYFNKKKHFLLGKKTPRISSKSKTQVLRAFQNLMASRQLVWSSVFSWKKTWICRQIKMGTTQDVGWKQVA